MCIPFNVTDVSNLSTNYSKALLLIDKLVVRRIRCMLLIHVSISKKNLVKTKIFLSLLKPKSIIGKSNNRATQKNQSRISEII